MTATGVTITSTNHRRGTVNRRLGSRGYSAFTRKQTRESSEDARDAHSMAAALPRQYTVP